MIWIEKSLSDIKIPGPAVWIHGIEAVDLDRRAFFRRNGSFSIIRFAENDKNFLFSWRTVEKWGGG